MRNTFWKEMTMAKKQMKSWKLWLDISTCTSIYAAMVPLREGPAENNNIIVWKPLMVFRFCLHTSITWLIILISGPWAQDPCTQDPSITHWACSNRLIIHRNLRTSGRTQDPWITHQTCIAQSVSNLCSNLGWRIRTQFVSDQCSIHVQFWFN